MCKDEVGGVGIENENESSDFKRPKTYRFPVRFHRFLLFPLLRSSLKICGLTDDGQKFVEDALDMDWTENQQCVLCDVGGNLLVCSDDGCPISVHKSCMGCEAHFDDAGNFHCPYCVYKQYTAEASRLRSKVTLTKKALSIFLEAEMRDDNHQEPVVEMANKEGGISSKDKLVDENHQDPIVETANKDDETPSKDKVVDQNHSVSLENCDEIYDSVVPETPNEVINRNEGVRRVNNVNTCMMMVVYKPGSDHADACNQLQPDVSKRMKVDQQTGNGSKFKVVDQAKESKSADIWLTIDEQVTCKKRNKSVRFNMNGRKEEPVMEHIAKKESTQLSMINRNKRCRVLWSEQEEEMLKEGVQKYSKLTKKNLSWKKILEFGRHVFDSSRTPSELKDKWRNIAK
ncbi:hypothetical protein L1987_84677 [Smallanthus sonchifolius]|uniref:Uncharacterized protein n=1 Tax=Smallanthus sonchifolius TaxID=185202 RepID=A0ACB8XV24_9ASTR|nr:hypothetical protein L1987_84677 [Smallanthus sonchifolius]